MEYLIITVYILALSFVFLFSLSQLQLTMVYLRGSKKTKPVLPRLSEWPMVSVQLPIYNEKYVVKRLIEAVVSFDYPKDKLEIQLLDDSTDETTSIIEESIEIFQKQGVAIRLIRRPERIGFKAGALDYGMQTAKGEFIAIFDADFIPQPDFLKSALPYFNSKTAVVQTRWGHVNRDYSLLTRLQAFGLDAHFTIEQVGRNISGSFINFNGTSGIWRKSAIEDAGGWSADTLTEDLDLSYRAQKRGWQFSYAEDIEVPAELPVIMPAIRSQQFRWNKGGAENARKHILSILKGDFPAHTKWHAFFHLFNSSIFIAILFAALLSVPVLWLMLEQNRFEFIAILGSIFFVGFLSIAFFYWVSYKRIHPQKSIWKFTGMFLCFITISMGLSWHNAKAVFLGLIRKKSDFVRTPKFNVSHKADRWQGNSYITGKLKNIPIIEPILILYFSWAIYLGIIHQNYSLLLFHVLLLLGFSFVFVYSILSVYASKNKSK